MNSELDRLIEHKQDEYQRIKNELEALILTRQLLRNAVGANVVQVSKDAKAPSQPELMEAILRERGQPMHVTEIAKVLSTQLNREIKSDHVSSMLYRYQKRGESIPQK
jgi:hypothetical protein